MEQVTTVAVAAKLLGRTPQAIRKLCAKYHLGNKVNSRLRLLNEQDFRSLVRLIRKEARA